MQSYRIKVYDAIRTRKEEVEMPPVLEFTNKDAYNALIVDKTKNLYSNDGNTLMENLNERKTEDENFYFVFEFDEEASVTSIFLGR